MDELLVRAAIRDELSGPVEGIRAEVRGLRTEIDRTNRAAATGSRNLTSYGLGLGKLSSLARITTGALVRVARVGMHGIAAAAAGAAYGIIKVGTSYEKSLNLFAAVTRAGGTQMDRVRAKALALGADMKLPATSAADAAAAMTELSKGGFGVQASMSAARGTLQLAAAAQIDAAQAADIQSAALAQFHLKGTEAAHVADLLANTANAAQGEITDMAVALRYIGPVAHAAGEDIDSTSTAIAILAKNGILGQRAGTGLRGSIAALLSPSQRGAAALARLHIEAGRFTGFRDLTKQLEDARGVMGKDAFTRALVQAFGRENLSAVSSLSQAGVDGWDKMGKAVTRAGGAQELAEARTKGLSGAWQGFVSQLETAGTVIYTKVEPGLERLVRWIAERIPGAIDSAIGWVDKFGGRWSDLVDAISGGNNADIASAVNAFFGGSIPTGPLDKAISIVHDLADIVTNSLLPAFASFAPVALALVSPLALVDDVTHLLAGHTRLTTTLIKVAIGVWIAYKLAAIAFLVYDKLVAAWEFRRAAATGTATASTVAGRLALIAMTAASKAWQLVTKVGAAIQAAYTAATNALTLSSIRAKVALVASTIATAAVSAATKAYAAAQWLLNAAMSANPLTLVVLALVALAAAVYIAYQKSETFRDIVHKMGDALKWVWDHVLVPVGKFLGQTLVKYLKLVGDVWLTFYELVVRAAGWFVDKVLAGFELIIHGAASAFGWVPGIGDDLQAADAAFSSFRDSVATKFDEVADKIHGARDALDQLGKKKTTVTVDVDVVSQGTIHGVPVAVSVSGQKRAQGGWITGVGGPTSDNQMVLASPTEYMVRSAVATQNRGLMEWLNANGARPLSRADLAQAPVDRVPIAASPPTGESPTGPQPAGNLIVEAGGVVVHAQGAASNVDVAQAVVEGLRQYELERSERT